MFLQRSGDDWQKQTIHCPHGEGISPADLDRDGDADLVTGGRWYENRKDGTRWIEHVFTTAWTEEDAKVAVVDVNGDRRDDVVLTPAELKGETYRVAWYEAPMDTKRDDWKEHVVVAQIEAVIHSLAPGDFNDDGHLDLAIAEMHQGRDPDEVSIYLNEDRGNSWRKQVLSNNGSHDIVVADIQGDGDLDILGANHAGVHPLELWKNLGAARK